MKKVIGIAFLVSMLVSPWAVSSPDGGLVDRINEARTYPNKAEAVEIADKEKMQHRKMHSEKRHSPHK
ncbi:hypothetical protein [Marinobacter similis]|uniref:Uncharacterized protein n=1 Tax=Marinobacter similis TaxID=1420916 RepID=W5YLB7_9GAMM|nr:hypothetical protein [Marinobacter similis]AHI30002.1 hypothetical protein AU14_04365 [Marinobacter similis]